MKVYVVSTGEYSERFVHSVWSTKEKAHEMEKILSRNDRGVDIEEYEVDMPCKEKAGFRAMVDYATGNMCVPIIKDLWVDNPKPDVIYNPYICILDGEDCCGYEKYEKIIVSEHYSVEECLKAARDFRMKKMAEERGL